MGTQATFSLIPEKKLAEEGIIAFSGDYCWQCNKWWRAPEGYCASCVLRTDPQKRMTCKQKDKLGGGGGQIGVHFNESQYL